MRAIIKLTILCFISLIAFNVSAHHDSHAKHPKMKKSVANENTEIPSVINPSVDKPRVTKKIVSDTTKGLVLSDEYCRNVLENAFPEEVSNTEGNGQQNNLTLEDYRVSVFQLSQAMMSKNVETKETALKQLQVVVSKLQELDPDNFNLYIYYDNLPDAVGIKVSDGYKTTIDNQDYYLQPYIELTDENGNTEIANYLYDDEKIKIKSVSSENSIHAHSIQLPIPDGSTRTLFIDSKDFKHEQLKGQKGHSHDEVNQLGTSEEQAMMNSGNSGKGSNTLSEDKPADSKNKDGGMGHIKATTHHHPPCDDRIASDGQTKGKTFASNQIIEVQDQNHFLDGQQLKIIVSPPDCGRVATKTGKMSASRTAETSNITNVKIIGFTMLQLRKGIWVTTPTEYVAYYPY